MSFGANLLSISYQVVFLLLLNIYITLSSSNRLDDDLYQYTLPFNIASIAFEICLERPT